MKKSKSKEDELKKIQRISQHDSARNAKANECKVYLEGWIDGAKWMDQELDE